MTDLSYVAVTRGGLAEVPRGRANHRGRIQDRMTEAGMERDGFIPGERVIEL
jgi:hypothetical protein